MTAFRPGQSPPPVSTPTFMRHSSSRSLLDAVTLPMWRRAACVTIVCVVATATPGTAAADPSLGELRVERSVLIRRIAALTDDAAALQARASVARRRRIVANAVAEEARRHVVRYSVDAFI